MSNEPNYAALSPPDDEPRSEWSWADRRAELYDLINSVGHYRKLQTTQRELANRYDVALSTIQNDIQKVNEFQAENLGDHVEHELETLKNAAIEKYIDDGNVEKAYYLMNTHYELLMEAGFKDRAPEKHEVEQEISGTQTIEMDEETASALRDADLGSITDD